MTSIVFFQILSIVYEEKQNMPTHNMSLWYKDYLEPIIFQKTKKLFFSKRTFTFMREISICKGGLPTRKREDSKSLEFLSMKKAEI